MEKISIDDRQFYIKMIAIGIPVVIQNLISMGLNLIDTLMIGNLGEAQLAAVGAANQVFFVFSVSLFGLLSGCAVHTAQYFGANDRRGVQKMLGINYAVGFVISVFVTIMAYIFAEQLISIFSKDSNVIGYGISYIRIACISYTFSGLSFAISYNSRAIQNLVVPTTINFIALCVNAALNYILIFGKLGLEPLGVEGAAIATLTARIFEFVALIIYIYTRKEHMFKATFKELFGFSKEMFNSVMKTAVPVVFTEGSWAISVALIFAAYGKLGTGSLAAVQVANVFSDLLQALFFGVGNATAMLIGEKLGQNDKDSAFRFAKHALTATWVLNFVTTLAMILFTKPITAFYDFSPETTEILLEALYTMAGLITIKMIPYMYIVGIFRAGGDTMFCMKLEIGCNFFVQVPLAYIAVLLLHTSLPVALIIVEAGDIIRILFSVPRFRTRKWINLVTEHANS